MTNCIKGMMHFMHLIPQNKPKRDMKFYSVTWSFGLTELDYTMHLIFQIMLKTIVLP